MPRKHQLLISFYWKQKAVSTITIISAMARVFRMTNCSGKPCERDSFTDELWPGTSNPAQTAQWTRRGVMPQMRSSACLNDRNCVCPSRTVPIFIRQTFNEGVQELLDTSCSESNSSLEKLDRRRGAWSTQDICIQTLQLFQSNHLNPIKRILSGRS